MNITVINKHEIIPFLITWMSLEIIIQSKVSLAKKEKCHMIPLICENKKYANELIYTIGKNSQT